jgi:hypothetical protein
MVRVKLIALVMLCFSSLAFAQNNCPQGFAFAGTLSGSGAASDPFNKRVTLALRQDAAIDESFQQQKVRATNGKSGAKSNMQAQDVPKGILIIPYGESDQVYGQGWAVSEPGLKAIARDGNGKVTRYEFGMKLYCNVGATGANPQFGECTVNVDVCYKPLP